jgi:hypothetical protein
MPSKNSRLKRGLEKLQPKWKNPAAGKALYLFGAGAVSMAFSLLAPFWYVSDITAPGVLFTLDPIGGKKCSEMTLPEGKLWHRDLCCQETKDAAQLEEAARISAIDPKERTDKERDDLKTLDNMLPVCDESAAGYCPTGLCAAYSQCDTKPDPEDPLGFAVIALTQEEKEECKILCTPSDESKLCKYYQHGHADTILGLGLFATIVGFGATAYAAKSATKPDASDVLMTKIVGTAGLLAFILGLLGIALFTPGTRGETAHLGSGFFIQIIGLCFTLGGTITIFDAGHKDLVTPALSFAPVSTDNDDDAAGNGTGDGTSV